MTATFELSTRASGVLMHVSSLPGPAGCGDLGPAAHAFADFLVAARQRWWQMLPVGPAGAGDSPYSSRSAFAGHPLFVSVRALVADGLLRADELPPEPSRAAPRADFAAAATARHACLRRAHERVRLSPPAGWQAELDAFRHAASEWLDDYAVFAALDSACGGRPWPEWPAGVRRRNAGEMRAAREALAEEIDYHVFVQLLFDRQWRRLRSHCHARGVGLIGDLPLYVAPHSADTWSRPELFELDRAGRPRAVAGVPPDGFSVDGQRWGMPVYRWGAHERGGFDWWIERLRCNFERFDALRIDHFIGLVRYWRIPAAAPTARTGQWCAAPGARLVRAARDALGPRPMLVEDLGALTPEVCALRDQHALPGMAILQWAFDSGPDGPCLPHRLPRRVVAYTGTHDNNTLRGWFDELCAAARSDERAAAALSLARRYLGAPRRAVPRAMLRAAWASPADLAIAPMQDLLDLDGRSCMNLPGTSDGNWGWRMRPGAASPALAAEMRLLTAGTGRAAADWPPGRPGRV